jgi:hypothetical protein
VAAPKWSLTFQLELTINCRYRRDVGINSFGPHTKRKEDV